MDNKTKTLTEVLTLIKEKGYQLDFDIDVPDEFKGNTEVIASIMEHSSLDFDKLPESARNDRQVLILIANKESGKFPEFPEWAKDDKDIVKSLSDFGWGVFENISERLRADREIVLLGLSEDSSNILEHVTSDELKNDKEILKIAAAGHSQAIFHFPEKWKSDKELLDIILSKEIDGLAFSYFPESYRDDQEIAKKVIQDSYCYQYLSYRLRDDYDLAILAIKKDTRNFDELSLRLRDSKEIALLVLEQNDNNRVMLNSMSERLKKDKEIAVMAMEKQSDDYSYIDEAWFEDPDIINACLKDREYFFGSAYRVFATRFQEDREITLKMSLGRDFPLEAAPDEFKNDKAIVLNAIKSDANNFKHIGHDLLKDVDFIKELYAANDGILYYMDENLKSKLFTTSICSSEHYGRKIIYEMVIDDGYVQNYQRPVKVGFVQKDDAKVVHCENFPVLTYENDGPVGSYLSNRYLCNFLLCGNFVFFIKENSGGQTFTHHLSKNDGYGPGPQASDDFLKHEVYLIPESITEFSYNNLDVLPRLYFGRTDYLPNGIKLFSDYNSYSEALTILNQEEIYGEPKIKKINDNTLEVIAFNIDEIFGAALVYVEGFGWRFLIPHKEGALKALEELKVTTDIDDLNWIKSQSGDLSTYQEKLLKEHFGDLY